MTLKELIKKMNDQIPEYELTQVGSEEEERVVEKNLVSMMRDAKSRHDKVFYDKVLGFYNDYLYIVGEI